MTWIEGDVLEWDAFRFLPIGGDADEGADVWTEERDGRDIPVVVTVCRDDEIDRIGRENILWIVLGDDVSGIEFVGHVRSSFHKAMVGGKGMGCGLNRREKMLS